MAGASVSWEGPFVSEFTPPTSVTDENGEAAAQWKLGMPIGAVAATVRVAGTEPAGPANIHCAVATPRESVTLMGPQTLRASLGSLQVAFTATSVAPTGRVGLAQLPGSVPDVAK